jgi:hypothetical protein
MTTSENAPRGEHAANAVPLSRLFDDGGPILFGEKPGGGRAPSAFVLSTSYCENPTCDCQDVSILARPARLDGEHLVEDEAVALEALLHLDTGTITPDVEPGPGTPEAALLDRLREEVRGKKLEALRARWHRTKHMGDADEWRTVDWSRVDLTANVPYFEVFPSRWDLSVVVDRRLWWIVDHWCLKPGCTCSEVGLGFHAEDGSAEELVGVDLPKRRLEGPEWSETGRRLWEAVRAEEELIEELDDRRADIRRVARKLPEFLNPPRAAAPPPGAGRNEPCPCGSGKKFKRCCGGVGAR